MTLRLIQIVTKEGERRVLAGQDDGSARAINGVSSTYELARKAIATKKSLDAQVEAQGFGAGAMPGSQVTWMSSITW